MMGLPLNIESKFSEGARVVVFPGDCRDLLTSMPEKSVALVVTSPPYNLGKEYESRLDLPAYLAQQKSILTECVRVLKPEGSLCWQVGNYVEDGVLGYELRNDQKVALARRPSA